MWGALGEPRGHRVVLGWLHRAASSKDGKRRREILAPSLAGGRSVKCGHVSGLLEAFWGL